MKKLLAASAIVPALVASVASAEEHTGDAARDAFAQQEGMRQ
jgi:hypothetical protein